MNNAFYFGDNLHILREYIPDESVDLIYLDPPFNSNANYNLLFKSPDRKKWSDAQIATFEDTWSWGEAAEETFDFLEMNSGKVGVAIASLRRILGANDMLAYLTMMAARLEELHRVLKPTGTLFLHCDPTASHYLKVLLDSIFGAVNFRTEISWRRQSAHNDGAQGRKQFGNVRDTIFFYTKSRTWTWNQLYTEYDASYVEKFYRHVEADTGRRYRLGDITAPGGADPKKRNPHYEFLGVTRYWRYSEQKMHDLYAQGRIIQTRPGNVPQYKRYLDEMPGVSLQNDWGDIKPLHGASREKLGYPTQKPLALLERIIGACSNEGDVVLDPFCGCGTTLHAAHSMGRKWLGIDVAVQAMRVVQDRLVNEFPPIRFEVFGIPQSADAARYLANKHPFKFEEWAVAAVGGMHSGKFRGDGGIDGSFFWLAEKEEKSRGVISVKGGRSLNPGMIRDLVGTLQRERTDTSDPRAIGVFICAHKPSKGMIDEARKAGFVDTFTGRVPAIQILTVEDIFEGRTIKVPALYDTVTAGMAGRSKSARGLQFRDPAEILRQRSMFFSFKGSREGTKQLVMPNQIAKVA